MLRAVANPAAGGQPGSFTTLTVTGAATIGGGLAVTGSISATGGVVLDSYTDWRTGGVVKGNIYTDATTMYINSQATITSIAAGGGNTLVGGNVAVTGSISATDYIAGAEQTPPSAPAANGYRIFAQDNGAGKTQLMVLFASGAAQQIAIEP